MMNIDGSASAMTGSTSAVAPDDNTFESWPPEQRAHSGSLACPDRHEKQAPVEEEVVEEPKDDCTHNRGQNVRGC